MDEAELMRIVVEEGLYAPVLDGTRHRGPDAVILERDGATWKVFVTDERASPHAKTIRLFEHESDAMEHVLLKLRQGKKYDESMARWRRRREQPGGPRVTDRNTDLSEAIVVYLTNYPGKNDAAFEARYGASGIREEVRAMLDETISTRIDWAGVSLSEIGDELERVMRERHPELSEAAIRKLSNYYTYLVK